VKTYYKLTDAVGRTYGGTQWGPGVRHETVGAGEALCSDGWIHCYDHPLLAVLLNPIGANFDPQTMRLWEFAPDEGTPELDDCGLKRGVKAGATVREIPVPVITTAQRVRWAILCARATGIPRPPTWEQWADNWLSSKDRTAARGTAERAAAAEAARAAAAWEAERAAAWAARHINLVALAEQAIREETTP